MVLAETYHIVELNTILEAERLKLIISCNTEEPDQKPNWSKQSSSHKKEKEVPTASQTTNNAINIPLYAAGSYLKTMNWLDTHYISCQVPQTACLAQR